MALSIEACGASADSGRDATPSVRAALTRLRGSSDRRLILPAGRFDFWPDRAAERHAFLANNDEGLKRITFPILDLNDVEIVGEGTLLVFHGRQIPFLIDKSRGVRLSGFAIDWQRPFHTEAEVLAEHRLGLDLRIPAPYPYRVEAGRLILEDDTGVTYGLGNALEWDPGRRETALRAADNYGIGGRYAVETIGPREVRMTARFNNPRPRAGNHLVLVDERRDCPAIAISNSADVAITDVFIHHAGAMGVIAQRSEAIRLERVHVTPRRDGGRLVSTQNDATHFVQCRGAIELVDCLFENQMDDATNIHGIHAQVTERIRADAVELRLVHRQQRGFDFVAAGERLQLRRGGSLEIYGEASVHAVQRVNGEFMRVTFDGPLPADAAPGDVAVNMSWVADATIRGCVAQANRARGFLLSTEGRIRVEGCRFHTPGAAILIEGDAAEWFEAGAVRDVVIQGNHFENCNYGVWGRSTIQVSPVIASEHRPAARYHRNIRIEGNRFVAFDRRLVYAHCVDGLTFRGNTVQESSAYEPASTADAQLVESVHCSNVEVEAPANA